MASGSTVGALREQQPGASRRSIGVPDVAVRPLGPDQEPGPVRGIAVDPVELAEPVAFGVHDDDTAALGLVDVLAPFLAEVAPHRVLVRSQVDDPGRCRLDGRGRTPTRLPQGQSEGPVGVARAVELDLGIDAQVRDPPGGDRQVGADRVRERADLVRRPRMRDGTAGCIAERPRQRPGTPDEDLCADRFPGSHPVRRPAVHGLDLRPRLELQVGTRIAGLDEGVPIARVCEGRHDRRGRRSASTMIPTIERSSSIRKASAATTKTAP